MRMGLIFFCRSSTNIVIIALSTGTLFYKGHFTMNDKTANDTMFLLTICLAVFIPMIILNNKSKPVTQPSGENAAVQCMCQCTCSQNVTTNNIVKP